MTFNIQKANMNHSNDEPRNTLWRLIKDMKFGMFTTHHDNGHLHARPMTTQNHAIDEHDLLWFFMSRKAETVADLLASPQVNVVYADSSKDTYVSVSGEASLVEDMAKKKELWSVFVKAWFPDGVEDADLALVQVKISHAHYWDVDSSKLVQLYSMVKAVVTGKPPTDMGDSGEVRMHDDQIAHTAT